MRVERVGRAGRSRSSTTRHGPAHRAEDADDGVRAGVDRRQAHRRPPGRWPARSATRIFVIDQSRCIGCQACVQACEECGTHRGTIDDPPRRDRPRRVRPRPSPMVCMHCEDPTCAEVCPADAIKQNEDGVVQSSLKPRCIGCSNCVLACPFGVPKYERRHRPDDEVRHVLRPHVGRPEADVRVGVPERGAVVRHARGVRRARAPGRSSTSGGSATSTWPPRSAPWSHEPGADRRARRRRRTAPWQDDPFGLDELEVRP